MRFAGAVHPSGEQVQSAALRTPAAILVDTGASHCFISADVAHLVQYTGQHFQATLADGSRQMSLPECTFEVSIDEYTGTVTVLVMEMGPDVQVLLGREIGAMITVLHCFALKASATSLISMALHTASSHRNTCTSLSFCLRQQAAQGSGQ